MGNSGNSAGDAPAASVVGWSSLLRREWMPALAVLLGGVLLHSMNTLLVATVLPSIVREVGGAALITWPTTAFLSSSIVAASCTGLLAGMLGAGRTFCAGAVIFGSGALVAAFAPTMALVIAGRFVQGFGGGLLSAMAYVLVRNVFPAPAWPRVFALLSGVWSFSVLVGPLVGGVFARYGNWRGALYTVAAIGLALAVVALRALPHQARSADAAAAKPVPTRRIGLICLAIVVMSLASVTDWLALKAGLIVLALVALAGMLRLDRAAEAPLLPSDAFTLGSPTGVGLWTGLLLLVAFSPLQIFVPIFLQQLHGFDPLAAGYTTASGSFAWTAASIVVAGLTGAWARRVIVIGPLSMMAGLAGIALMMPTGPVEGLVPAIVLLGAGIGCSWAFIVQHIMRGARAGEEDIAASSAATVQQVGLAFGAAIAGLVANAVGFSVGRDPAGILNAAFWVPAAFTVAAAAAAAMALRLGRLARHSD